ncbi:MAG: YdbL family protein [Verrucomicrobiota bacterium]|nr:YdbL family protein [Verrucomicrobiota bacterium]
MAGLALAAVAGAAGLARAADDIESIKARRKARREQVAALVQAGDAKEGDDGYLAPKAGLDAAKDAVVKAENADRKLGYAIIAKQNGKSVEDVGKQAAEINKKKAK